jgi:hypothetical protein
LYLPIVEFLDRLNAETSSPLRWIREPSNYTPIGFREMSLHGTHHVFMVHLWANKINLPDLRPVAIIVHQGNNPNPE